MKKFSRTTYVSAFLFTSLLSLGCSAQLIGSTGNLITWYKPAPMTTWQIQLQGNINPNLQVALYDIDLFDTPTTLINQLHANGGKKVICYFSAGSGENWRPDYSKFKSSDLGNALSGWAGERWLDVRSANVRAIMAARMDLAKQKGCNGIDADNVDGYTNNPGFPFTAQDQISYNTFLANEAHKRGLTAGLKNDLDQVKALAPSFDFAVNEQCFQYNECNMLAPFTALGKPVYNIEYKRIYQTSTTARAALCNKSRSLKFSTLVMNLALNDKVRYSCLAN